jgi:hypothetical protein
MDAERPRKPGRRSRAQPTFHVLVMLKDGRVVRCPTRLGLRETLLFCRDLKRWLIGSRQLRIIGRGGEVRFLDAGQVDEIDVTLCDEE